MLQAIAQQQASSACLLGALQAGKSGKEVLKQAQCFLPLKFLSSAAVKHNQGMLTLVQSVMQSNCKTTSSIYLAVLAVH